MQAIYFVLFIPYKYRVTGIRLRIKAKLTKIYAKTFMTVWIGPLHTGQCGFADRRIVLAQARHVWRWAQGSIWLKVKKKMKDSILNKKIFKFAQNCLEKP